MKRLIFAVLLVMSVSTLFAQQSRGPFIPALNIKTYHPFTATSDDTTGWITVPVKDVLDASEITLIWVSNDSVQAAVYVIGKNTSLSSKAKVLTYTDSISTIAQAFADSAAFASSYYMKGIPIKGPGYNRLPGCTSFKVGTVFTAATGTRVTNYGRWYLYWRP
jgi:hypothetical protein